MGGRGQKYTVIKRLPNYGNAVIPRNKVKNYVLNPSKDPNKANFFANLGYNMQNFKMLISDIKSAVATTKALHYVNKDKFGNDVYQVNVTLGINKKAIVTTGWIVEPGSNVPKLVTLYHNKKLDGR